MQDMNGSLDYEEFQLGLLEDKVHACAQRILARCALIIMVMGAGGSKGV